MIKSLKLVLAAVILTVGGFSSVASAQETQLEKDVFYLPAGDSVSGRNAFIRLQCTSCHRVTGDPDLPAPTRKISAPHLTFGPAAPADRVAQAIISPSHTIAPGFGQGNPEDAQVSPMQGYSDSMTLKELRDIVAYLRRRVK